jgi:hypothetical protein
MTRRCVCAVATLLLCPPLLMAAQPATNADAAVLADFTKRMNEYVGMRKSADDSARPLQKTDDPAKIRMAQQELADRIRAARSGAKQGDIFTPAISAHFRRLLRPETKARGTRASIKDDNPPVAKVPFKINGAYPESQPLATAPPNVLQSLPELPKDLEYRFVGKHLVLRDARANLIIDFIPDAIS